VADDARLTLSADVADLEAVRKAVGAERVSIVGFSYLGLMAALYAMENPGRVERLVQIGPLGLKRAEPYPPELRNDDARQVLDAAWVEEVQDWRKRGLHRERPREFCEKQWRIIQRLLVADAAGTARIPSPCDFENEWPVNFDRHIRVHFQGTVLNAEVSRADLAAKVTQPVLVIHGRMDRNAPYGGGRDWAELLPGARLITLDRAAHQAWVDEPRVLSWVDAFLAGRWPPEAESLRAPNGPRPK
jgi:pimeloyl-ACP methyl ester carboxylesterase